MTFEWDAHADAVIEEVQEFLDIEANVIKQEHELHEKMLAANYIVTHLDERIPKENAKAHEINGQIMDTFIEIQEVVESGVMNELQLLREEKSLLIHLQGEVVHRDWRAVKGDADAEGATEKKVIRLQIKELKELHALFKTLVKQAKALAEELGSHDAKKYAYHLHKLAKTYEHIFHHLIKKEEMLTKKS